MQFLLNPKHYTLKRSIFILISVIGLIVYSCKHDDKGISPLPDKVASAKAWYESVYPQMLSNTKGLVSQSVGSQTDPSQIIKPDWKNAATYTRLGQNVIEMPVDPSVKLILIFKTNTFAFNKSYSRSYYVLLSDKQKYQAYILTFLADSSWVNNDLSKLGQNSYRKVAADFSGWVVYNTPKGEYLGGYGYKNGKLVTPSTASAPTGNQKVQSLDGGVLKPNNMVQVCTDNYYRLIYVNDQGVESYGPWEYVSTTCTYIDDGSGTSTGGSGGTGSTGSTGSGSSSSPAPPPPKPCPPTSGTPTCSVPVADALKTNFIPAPTDPGAPPPPTTTPCTVPTADCALVTNNVTNPCLHNMVNAAINSNIQFSLNQSMNSIFGSNTNFNINFMDDIASNLASPTEDGQTTVTHASSTTIPGNPPRQILNDMSITITLNRTVLSNPSKEYVTATIIHEALHAYLTYTNTVLDQHTDMFQNYFDTMEQQLMHLYPNLSQPDAYALTWGGLEKDNKTAFNALGTAAKNTIELTNTNYQTGQKGAPCGN